MALLARFDPPAALTSLDCGQVCMRCKSNQAAVSVRGEVVCEHCLVAYVSKRARQAMTSLPMLGHVVAVSTGGGPCSTVMIDQAQTIMHCGRKRRWWLDAVALHVDLSALAPLLWAADTESAAELLSQEHTRAVLTQAASAGLVTALIPIECALQDEPLVLSFVIPPSPAMPTERSRADPMSYTPIHGPELVREGVDAALAAVEAWRKGEGGGGQDGRVAVQRARGIFGHAALRIDDRQQLLDALTTRLCAEVSAGLGIPHLLAGCSVDRLAEGVMTAAGAGAGASMPADVAPIDRRWGAGVPGQRTVRVVGGGPGGGGLGNFPHIWYAAESQETPARGSVPDRLFAQPSSAGVLLIRPFLELERKECALYCELRRGLDSGMVLSPTFTRAPGRGPKSSAASVNASILASLAASFPSTLHNVVRTARKLTLPWGEGEGVKEWLHAAVPVCVWCHGVVSVNGRVAGDLCLRCARLSAALPAFTAELSPAPHPA